MRIAYQAPALGDIMTEYNELILLLRDDLYPDEEWLHLQGDVVGRVKWLIKNCNRVKERKND